MTNESEYTVLMSTADQRTWYPLMYVYNGVEVSCVSSYVIYAGPNNPFEHIKIVLTKQDMARMAPGLKSIEPGKNLLSVNAVGSGQYTVTSCKYSDKKYTITAYTNADKIRRYTYPETKTLIARKHIAYILSSGTFGVKFDGPTLIWDYLDSKSVTTNITIVKGSSVWTALQICAMSLGCRVFFADGKAFIAGWTRSPESELDFDIHNESYTLVGCVSQGNVGSNTVTNYVSGRCRKDNKDIDAVVCGTHAPNVNAHIYDYSPAVGSEFAYNRREGGVYDLLLLNEEQTKQWLKNCLDYTVEAQVDVSFKLNENTVSSNGLSWVPHFSPYECVLRIQSYIDEVDVTAESSIGVSTGTKTVSKEVFNPATNQTTIVSEEVPDGINAKKLLLSSVERYYPEGYSEYTFGQVKNISLSNSTSEIYSSLGTKMTNPTK